MKRNVLIFLTFFIFKITAIYAYIDVLNLGIINYKNKINGQSKLETEDLNYNHVKSKVLSVLNSNKIKYKVRTGLIESNWYNYNNKASKLYITILPDENHIRIQLHQKKHNENITSNIEPNKIKRELENVLK